MFSACVSVFPQAQADTSSAKKTQKEKGGQKVKEKAKKAPPPAAAVPGSTNSPPEIMEVNTFVVHCSNTHLLILKHIMIARVLCFPRACAILCDIARHGNRKILL